MNMKKKLESHAENLWNNHRKLLVILTFFLATQLIIVKAVWNQPPIWYASVYIGMGKRIFSGGLFGLWESFRPLVLPLILGTLWKIGIPMIGVPYLLSTLGATAGLATMYFLTEEIIDKKTALYATGITASTSVFYTWTHQVLTGIPSSFLVFGAAYAVYQRKNILGGGLNSLAFLTRFPSAIVGPALAGYVFLRDVREDFQKAFMNAFYYTATFFTLAAPFFAFNYYRYGDILKPITAGASVPVNANPDKYFFGLFYIREAILANPLLVLMPIGLGIAFYKREKVYGSFAAALIALYGFFTVYGHKEARFMLIFLPLMAVFAARGLKLLEEKVVERSYLSSENFLRAFVVVVLVLTAISFSATYASHQWSNEPRVEFMNEASKLNGTVVGNDPVLTAYGDFRYVQLKSEFVNGTYHRFKDEADYYAIDSGAWYCNEAIPNCEENVASVVGEIDRNHLKKVQIEGHNNNYTIYEVENR